MAVPVPGARHAPWLVPVAVAVVGSMGVNAQSGHVAQASAGVLAAVAGAAVVLAGWLPRTGAVLVAAALTCYLLAGLETGPVLALLPAGVFVAARRLAPRALARVLAPAVATSALAMLARDLLDGVRGRQLWQSLSHATVLLVVAAAAAVLARWLVGRDLARAERSRRAVTEERLRMAQDLHDGVGHGLAVVAMQSGVALHVLDRDPGRARESLEAIRDTSREALQVLRVELARMGHDSAGPDGRAPARPARGLDDLPGLVDRVRAGGLEVELVGVPGLRDRPVGTQAGAAVHAVVQEALTNVLRHSGARRATVRVHETSSGDGLVVVVTDDGRGAGPVGVPDGTHWGLQGMRDRVERLGGTLSAGPGRGGGFEVRAEVPVGTGRATG